MIKIRGGPLWGHARGDPPAMLLARGDPDPVCDKRSRAPTEYARCMAVNWLFLPERGRYGLWTVKNEII